MSHFTGNKIHKEEVKGEGEGGGLKKIPTKNYRIPKEKIKPLSYFSYQTF